MSDAPRYTGRHALRPHGLLCLDCGALVLDEQAHTRFHSILGGHGWALAVLKTAHIAAHVHAKYEVVERIDSKTFDNWSADALAEVVASMPDGDCTHLWHETRTMKRAERCPACDEPNLARPADVLPTQRGH